MSLPPGAPATEPESVPAPAPRFGFWSRISLQRRLIAILTLGLLLALLATATGTGLLMSRVLYERLDEDLRADARTIKATFETPMLDMPMQPRGLYFQFNYDNGKPSDGPPKVTLPYYTYAQALQMRERPHDIRGKDGRGHDFELRVITLPVRYVNDGIGTLVVARRTDDVHFAVSSLLALEMLFGLGVVAAGSMIGSAVIRRAFQPLAQVRRTAAAIAGGDLSQRLPQQQPPTTEVGGLTESLNQMLTQIERAFRVQEASEARTRRFAADASHELRTPLAGIRGFAELYRLGAVPTEDVPRTMRRIEDEAVRMASLVEELLLLARLDERQPTKRERVDLTVLAHDAAYDARALDPERTVKLIPVGDTGIGALEVMGDENQLRQVLMNLVGNALRHTPAGSSIEIAIGLGNEVTGPGALPDHAVVEVRDHGPGLSPEDASRIFERFVRLDNSRARKTGGSGLGLSIATAIVHAHNGVIALSSSGGDGATFRISLPLAGADPAQNTEHEDEGVTS